MRILETNFIDGRRVNYSRLSQLNIVIGRRGRITLGDQTETTQAAKIRRMEKVITRNQSVLRIDRVVEARTNVGVTRRHHQRLSDEDRIEIGIEDRRIDQRVVVHLV